MFHWRCGSEFLQVGTARQQQTETQELRERKREDNEKYTIIKKYTAIYFCLAHRIGNKSHTLQCISYAKCSTRREREGWGEIQRYEHDANSICDSILMEYITAGLSYPAKRNTEHVGNPCMASAVAHV
jgi:hypothetical protein